MKLPRSSFKILRMLILGYLHQGGSGRKPVTAEAVGKATGLNRTMVSANNKPLAEFGIIERAKGGLYGLTERGVEVARALEFEEPELIRRSLGTLLAENETVSSSLNTLRVRGGLDADAFANHIALAAVIEMLTAAGLVQRDGEHVRAASPSRVPSVESEPEPEAEPSETDAELGATNVVAGPPLGVAHGAAERGGVLINIDVTITGAELADPETGDRILERIRELSRLRVIDDE
jgi:predicted transcriptional regulator